MLERAAKWEAAAILTDTDARGAMPSQCYEEARRIRSGAALSHAAANASPIEPN